MPAVSTDPAWDFAPLISLIDTLTPKQVSNASLSTSSPTEPSVLRAVRESSSLGDFSSLWDYLGVPPNEPAPSVPPLDYTETTSDESEHLDDYDASRGLQLHPQQLSDRVSIVEDVAHLPDQVIAAHEQVIERAESDDSPAEDAFVRAQIRKEKRKGKKERRRMEREAKVTQAKELKFPSGKEGGSKAERPHTRAELPTPALVDGRAVPKTGTQVSQRCREQPLLGSNDLRSAVHRQNGDFVNGSACQPPSMDLRAKRSAIAPRSHHTLQTSGSNQIVHDQSKPTTTAQHLRGGDQTANALLATSAPSQHANTPIVDGQPPAHVPYIISPGLHPLQHSTECVSPLHTDSTTGRLTRYLNPTLTPAAVAPPKARKPITVRNAEDRNLELLLKLVRDFAEDKKWLAKPVQLADHTNAPNGVHVFIDFSNIWIGFMNHIKMLEGLHAMARTKHRNLSFDSLVLLLERGRPVSKRVLAGSSPLLPAFDLAKAIGYELNILDKVYKAKELTERQKFFQSPYRKQGKHVSGSGGDNSSGSETNTAQFAPEKWVEQGVDEILHLKILESVVDAQEPSTMVLATGDGAQAEYSDGFFKMVERALKKGWKVELVSWRKNINFLYHDIRFRDSWADMFKIVVLDEYAEYLLDT